MRMTLDQIIKQMKVLDKTYDPVAPVAIGEACRALKEYKQLKADYEARLKADMVAMLTEIQLEIEEKEQYYQDKFLDSKNAVHDAAMGGRMFGCGECKEVIQQKINELKGESND